VAGGGFAFGGDSNPRRRLRGGFASGTVETDDALPFGVDERACRWVEDGVETPTRVVTKREKAPRRSFPFIS